MTGGVGRVGLERERGPVRHFERVEVAEKLARESGDAHDPKTQVPFISDSAFLRLFSFSFFFSYES